ncbi:hypothetical protein MsAc7_17800 [Methanolapillus millepedarum]|uniref:Phage terminase large subunit N-terminal domain-containing protein n=1 Tax=Methanolapillus millepedarum TaxID=3028296 RepID=A0AA96VGP2_9EURY|nr:hypothetical protein MsAc7_17800 [Methanosarcinaceae archaeon Ac7]
MRILALRILLFLVMVVRAHAPSANSVVTASATKLSEIVGGGYKDFWEFKGRYRVVKGSRASKKSKTTALYYISMMMLYPDANLLVVRQVFETLRDSCYADL